MRAVGGQVRSGQNLDGRFDVQDDGTYVVS